MGHVRSPESAALHILRAIEDEGGKFRAAEIAVSLPPEIAFYLFNHKRDRLSAIEARYAMRVIFAPDATLTGTNFRIDKIRTQTATALPAPASYSPPPERAAPERPAPAYEAPAPEEEPEAEDESDEDAPKATDTPEEGERKRRRRRRGKRRNGAPNGAPAGLGPQPAMDGDTQVPSAPASPVEDAPSDFDLVLAAELSEAGEEQTPSGEAPARRRRSRGGRRRRGETGPAEAAPGEDPAAYEAPAPYQAPRPEPVYADIADIFEAAERAEAERLRQRQEAARAAAQPPAPAPEPILEPTADATPSGPVIKPIVIGAEDAPAPEKKRGWWRR
jgi:ribonuclease E